MDTQELIAVAEGLVKELQGRINGGGMGLQDAEAKILDGELDRRWMQEVVASTSQPTPTRSPSAAGGSL